MDCMFQSVPWHCARWGNFLQVSDFGSMRSLLATAPDSDITPMRDAIMMLQGILACFRSLHEWHSVRS